MLQRVKWSIIFIALAFFLSSTIAMSGYLNYLFKQLDDAFVHINAFVPTRLYSDVTRIEPGQPRFFIEAHLKALAYTPKTSTLKATATTLTFALHNRDYPDFLLPDSYVTQYLNTVRDTDGSITIKLEFDSPSAQALLVKIQVGEKEWPEVYLEPEVVATLGNSGQTQIREPLKLRSNDKSKEIPASIWHAIIAVEDQHFLEHNGFDPRGLLRAVWVNLKTRSFAQGGSTLTQQLVKNLMSRRGKNVFRKVNELFLSIMLETKYDKEQILERYLNEVYLGQVGALEVHGVAEGAEHFFGRRVQELNLAEIALMAGLIRGPGFYSPYKHLVRAKDRMKVVLNRMVETGHIAPEEAKQALSLPIRLAAPRANANKAPFFADYVKAELLKHLKDSYTEEGLAAAGLRVYTTIDPMLNTAAQNAITQGLTELEKRMKITSPIEGALASVDHRTGFIRALIGGRDYSHSSFNRILNMKRQVGSTFKPFVYLSALEKGDGPLGVPYGAGYPVNDAPFKYEFDQGRQTWEPHNYEKEFMSWIPLKTALAHSINTVTARLGVDVGNDRIIRNARKLGITSDLPDVPSLSLGVAELSPIEVLTAYATLANHGQRDELTVIRAITNNSDELIGRFVHHPSVQIEAGFADAMTDFLQAVFTDGTAHAVSKGWGFTRPAAGKTGTTSNSRDSWFAGYTPQLTTVVWVGPDQPGEKEFKLTGASAALPIWIQYMKTAIAAESKPNFENGNELSLVRIDKHSGKLATSDCPESQVLLEKYPSSRVPAATSCEALWP